MIHQRDQETLNRLLGTQSTPHEIEQEYEGRVRWYHRDGHQGPLGTLAIIDMLRFLDVSFPEPEPIDPNKLDWREIPNDGTARVKAGPIMGTMHAGRFMGFGSHGMLRIKLDEDGRIVDFRHDMVELISYSEPADDDPKTPQQEGFVADVDNNPPPFDTFDWSTCDAETPVWAQIDGKGEAQDATFLSVTEDGKVKVKIGKKHHELSPEHVALIPETGLVGVE